MKINPVVHFELPAEDRKRMSEFYTKTFGWKANQLGPEMNNYIVMDTGESDKNGPTKKDYINGGIYEKKGDMPAQYPSVVIAVDDIQAHMKKVKAAGGKILGDKPWDIPGVGAYISFIDTEGNRISMLQPKGM